jgi:DNA-binding response OmpR family regulator
MRVLIVEDDESIRQLLGRIVAREGVEVATVSGALDAIAVLENETFDLLLLDLMMPIYSGFDVINFLRRKRGRAATVVVISAAGDDLLRELDSEIVHGLLRKPFEVAAVLERIRGIRQSQPSAHDVAAALDALATTTRRAEQSH